MVVTRAAVEGIIILGVIVVPITLILIWKYFVTARLRQRPSLAQRVDCTDRPIVWNVWTSEGVSAAGEVDWAHIKVC